MTATPSDWRALDDPRFELRLRYPDPTPQGRAVHRDEGMQGDALRLHLYSAERELYVELMRFPLMPDDEEYRTHRDALSARFGEGSVSDLCAAIVAGRAGHGYGFRWKEGEREALLVSTASHTYRIIYNSASLLNTQVVATLELV
jgi:hypothetical protein